MLQGLYLYQEGHCPGHRTCRESFGTHWPAFLVLCVFTLGTLQCYSLHSEWAHWQVFPVLCVFTLGTLQSLQWMAFLCITADPSISSDIRPWQWITVLTDYCLSRSDFSFVPKLFRDSYLCLPAYRWILWIFTLNLWPQRNGSESGRLSFSLHMLNPGNARQLDGLGDPVERHSLLGDVVTVSTDGRAD